MSTDQPTSETVVPEPVVDPAQETVSTGTPPAEPEHPSREAASYRARLRETEAARDALAGRLEVYERQHVERIAAERMLVPSDFPLLVPDLEGLRGEDGQIDEDIVRGVVETVLADRPTWDRDRQPRLPAPNPAQGRSGRSAPARKSGQESFSDVVSDALKR